MNIDFNTLYRQYTMFEDEYNKAALDTLRSGWYILGKEVEEFEKEFSKFCGFKHCVALNSGLDALILALRILNIGEGDEVIVPANTFIASIIGITENGATPVFVEPDEYFNIDVSKIENSITKKTKAIIPVHLYGQACNMESIEQIAKKNNLFIVEDCAQAHGAKYKNKNIGTFSDIACFSFYPTKNLGAFGDGGAIITDNDMYNEKFRMIRNYGSKIKYINEIEGINSRLDEIQAALLKVKLKHYSDILNQRLKLVRCYLDGINNSLVKLPKVLEHASHVWHLFVVQVDDRIKFENYLKKHGISTQIHYPLPPHLSKAYEFLGYKKGDFPITERYSEKIISLPLFDGMTEEEINYVIDIVNKYRG